MEVQFILWRVVFVVTTNMIIAKMAIQGTAPKFEAGAAESGLTFTEDVIGDVADMADITSMVGMEATDTADIMANFVDVFAESAMGVNLAADAQPTTDTAGTAGLFAA